MSISVIDTTPQPNEELVKELETLLERAKKGDIQTAIFCYCFGSNSYSHGWNVPTLAKAFALLAEVSYAKYALLDMIHQCHEQDEDG